MRADWPCALNTTRQRPRKEQTRLASKRFTVWACLGSNHLRQMSCRLLLLKTPRVESRNIDRQESGYSDRCHTPAANSAQLSGFITPRATIKKRIGRSKKSVTVERSNPNGCAGLKKEITNLPYSCNEHSVMQADR